MKDTCREAVSQYLGRSLTALEERNIEERIRRAMRALAAEDNTAYLAMADAERLRNAATRASAELEHDAIKKQQRTALVIEAHDRIATHVDEMAAKGVDGLDALARVVAFHADGKSDFLSVESRTKAIRADALRQMVSTLEASNPKFFGLFENQEGMQAIVRALFHEKTGIKEADDGATLFHQVAEALRQRFNKAGSDIGKLEDYDMPHHHSQAKVSAAGRDAWLRTLPAAEQASARLKGRNPPPDVAREAWVADVMPKLDRARYFNEDGTQMGDVQLADFLRDAWLTIATGGVNKIQPGSPSGHGMRANRGADAHRSIHFKDADSFLDYQKQYGDKDLYSVLVDHIGRMAKDIALVETFGPNPDSAYAFFRDQAHQSTTLENPSSSGKFDKKAASLDNLYNYVSGKTIPVASERMAKSFDTVRSWLVASRLGSAVITSFSDEATMHMTAHVLNLPGSRMLMNELAALNLADPGELRLARRAGLSLDTLIGGLNRFGQEGLGAPFSAKMANFTMRASGLSALTDARKRAFGVTMMDSLGSTARDFGSLAKLDKGDHRLLLSKGITEQDWSVWRLAKAEDWGGNHSLLTPESIARIPDAELAKLGDDPARMRQEAITKLLGVVLEETDMAVIEPGAREKAWLHSGYQRGTWKGEIMRSVFLFKSFPIAMISRHWMRGWGMETAGGKATYLSSLFAATTVLGAVSMEVDQLLQGKDPRNLNPFEGEHGYKNWVAAMLKGGSLGIYGDFLFSEATQHGGSPVASFLGPVIGLSEDILNLTQGNLVQFSQGKPTHAGAELVKFLRGNTPGASLWYAKAALNHMLVHDLQEYLSPGYLSSMQSKARRNFGQDYWLPPGNITPDRTPDLGKAVGQ